MCVGFSRALSQSFCLESNSPSVCPSKTTNRDGLIIFYSYRKLRTKPGVSLWFAGFRRSANPSPYLSHSSPRRQLALLSFRRLHRWLCSHTGLDSRPNLLGITGVRTPYISGRTKAHRRRFCVDLFEVQLPINDARWIKHNF